MSRSYLIRSRANAAAILGLFLATVVAIGSLAGILAQPNAWFAHLNKPVFLPPTGAFTPIWLAIYILSAIVGWRIWLKPARTILMFLWIVQVLMYWLWAPVFHLLKVPAMALSMLATAGAMQILLIIFMRKSDKTSVVLLAPQLIWTAIIGLLNGAIMLMN